MRRRRRYQPPQWDGIARYTDGTPIDVIKREVLDAEMRAFDSLPPRKRAELRVFGGVALEEAQPPGMTGLR